MIFDLSAPLAVALQTLERVGAEKPVDDSPVITALCVLCDYIPERAEDADAILEIARASLSVESDAHAAIINAQTSILRGDIAAALVALSEAEIVARNEGAFVVERLCLNVAAGPVPAVLAYRPPLPWEHPTLH